MLIRLRGPSSAPLPQFLFIIMTFILTESLRPREWRSPPRAAIDFGLIDGSHPIADFCFLFFGNNVACCTKSHCSIWNIPVQVSKNLICIIWSTSEWLDRYVRANNGLFYCLSHLTATFDINIHIFGFIVLQLQFRLLPCNVIRRIWKRNKHAILFCLAANDK